LIFSFSFGSKTALKKLQKCNMNFLIVRNISISIANRKTNPIILDSVHCSELPKWTLTVYSSYYIIIRAGNKEKDLLQCTFPKNCNNKIWIFLQCATNVRRINCIEIDVLQCNFRNLHEILLFLQCTTFIRTTHFQNLSLTVHF
jgi:hypothetical protein